MSLTSLAALQVEVTPIVPDVRSTHSTMRAPTEHKKSLLPFHCSYLLSLLWCDKATVCRWPLHLVWVRIRVWFILFCLCGVGAIYVDGRWQRTTWSDSEHWHDLHFFFLFSTTVSLWGLSAMPASFSNSVELWCAALKWAVSFELVSESVHSVRVEWD